MGELEYEAWKYAMAFLLGNRGYTSEERIKILDWWDGIKAKREHALVGDEKFDLIMKLSDFPEKYNSFDNWTIRLLLYAPFILKEKE